MREKSQDLQSNKTLHLFNVQKNNKMQHLVNYCKWQIQMYIGELKGHSR